jgi:tetratricopeptide (TPR) repeat protein/uncharacterized membrane protein
MISKLKPLQCRRLERQKARACCHYCKTGNQFTAPPILIVVLVLAVACSCSLASAATYAKKALHASAYRDPKYTVVHALVRGGANEQDEATSTRESGSLKSTETDKSQNNATNTETEGVALAGNKNDVIEAHNKTIDVGNKVAEEPIQSNKASASNEDNVDDELALNPNSEAAHFEPSFAMESEDTSSDDEDGDDAAAISRPMSTITVLETTTTTLLSTTSEEIETTLSSEIATKQPSLSPTLSRTEATRLRTLGKELHDKSEFKQAAVAFEAAADLLVPLLISDRKESVDDEPADEKDNNDDILEEFATCRLHEALCRLKAQEYDLAIQACTQVLECNHPSPSSPESSSHDHDGNHGPLKFSQADVAPALRARAFHRRAKAYMELGNSDQALSDARSAAFLGDRKAVALYGKLMRSSSGNGSSSSVSGLSAFGDLFGNRAEETTSSSSAGSMLESLLGASSALSSASSSNSQQPIASPTSPFLPSSLLDFGKAAPGGQGAGSLAKSVLSSLAKRLEDKSTQDTICNYLQSTSGPQLQQMASMAGLSLQSSQASQLANFMNRATPKAIQRTVVFTKRGVYAVQLLRKFNQLMQKYRNLIILFFLLAWIKSAILRPTPVSKRAIKAAAKQAAKSTSGLIV